MYRRRYIYVSVKIRSMQKIHMHFLCLKIHMHFLCLLVFDILNRPEGPRKDLFKEVLAQNVCMYICIDEIAAWENQSDETDWSWNSWNAGHFFFSRKVFVITIPGMACYHYLAMIQPPNVNNVNGSFFCATRPKSKWDDSRLLGRSDCGCWSFVMLQTSLARTAALTCVGIKEAKFGLRNGLKKIGQMRGGQHMTSYDYLSFTRPKIFLAGAFRYDTWGEMIQLEYTFSTTKHLCLQFCCWKSIFFRWNSFMVQKGKFPHVFIDVVEVFQRIDGRSHGRHFRKKIPW